MTVCPTSLQRALLRPAPASVRAHRRAVCSPFINGRCRCGAPVTGRGSSPLARRCRGSPPTAGWRRGLSPFLVNRPFTPYAPSTAAGNPPAAIVFVCSQGARFAPFVCRKRNVVAGSAVIHVTPGEADVVRKMVTWAKGGKQGQYFMLKRGNGSKAKYEPYPPPAARVGLFTVTSWLACTAGTALDGSACTSPG